MRKLQGFYVGRIEFPNLRRTHPPYIKSLEFPGEITAFLLKYILTIWEAVQTNHLYKEQHPDEEIEHYKSGVDFLKEENLALAYQQMVRDECRELEALEWAEATIGDVADETR